MQHSAYIIDQAVDLQKFTDGCQVIIRIRELADKVTCQEAVYHEKQILLELYAYLLFESPFFYSSIYQCPNIFIQRIVRI